MQAMIRIPILIVSDTGKVVASTKPISGMKPNCATTPTPSP